ncbi:MAG: hypothetical protein ABSA85_01555 [Terracidiphilus sp.]|jgi:hypothetical protein
MNWQQDMAGESQELEQALKHFKASMDAWSDAAYSRPRTAAKLAVRPAAAGWRMAASWALGCLLAAGSLAGGVHEIYHRQELARIAAQKAAQQAAEQRAAAARVTVQPSSVQQEKKTAAATTRKVSATQDYAGAQDDDLLASVDSDVSRDVPAAMEPLAQLMDDNGTQ